MMSKEAGLRRVKRLALLLLCAAAATFVVTLFLPPWFWVRALKAVAESAMVGALADWFAVVALFHHIPIPLISRHTAIIPRNKNRIGDNLGYFVQEKFLDTASLLALIHQHDPARIAAVWLSDKQNATRLVRPLIQVIHGFLDLTDDKRIRHFLLRAVHKLIDKFDLSQTTAILLESLTKNNRHQVLLDSAITQLLKQLNTPASREFIALHIVRWLKREHPLKAQLLPTTWLGEHSAELVTRAVNSLLDDINQDSGHTLRQAFNRSVENLIVKMKTDAKTQQTVERIKNKLKEDEALNRYISSLWQDIHRWLKADLAGNATLQTTIAAAAQWIGNTLQQDATLRTSLNEHLEQAAGTVAPEFAAFLTRHISDTIKSWDERTLSQQIEQNIGKDLQFIRINGTLVGGTIGLLLFLLSQIPTLSRFW